MRNVESIDATPGTLELPESRFTVSPSVVSASSGVSGSGIVHTTSSMTGMLPKLHRMHFCDWSRSAAATPVTGAPRPNGMRRTFSWSCAYFRVTFPMVLAILLDMISFFS